MKSDYTKASEISHEWHLVDADKQTLGRVSTKIATLLMGKHKPYFVRNLDCGDYVVVLNSQAVTVTGSKAKTKIYTSYSGYPGGSRKESFQSLHERKPTEVIRLAVYGMLPKNKIRDLLAKRLYIYPDSKHPYENKFKKA